MNGLGFANPALLGALLTPTIDYESSAQSVVNTSASLTYSHTIAGDNRILFVGVFGLFSSTFVCTGVTFNGVAMTKVDSQTPTTNWDQSLWYLIAPDAGAHNIVVTCNGTATKLIGMSASYIGSAQMSLIDISGKATANSTSVTKSITTTIENDWVIGFGLTGADTISPGTGVTSRQDRDVAGSCCNIGDSNGAILPAGSYSMAFTGNTAHFMGIVMAAFKPSG